MSIIFTPFLNRASKSASINFCGGLVFSVLTEWLFARETDLKSGSKLPSNLAIPPLSPSEYGITGDAIACSGSTENESDFE